MYPRGVRGPHRALGPKLALAIAAGLALSGGSAWARQNGIAVAACNSCHTEMRTPMVSVTMDPATVDPGGKATVTVHIASSAAVAGFYLHSFEKGTFTEIPGQGTRLSTPTEVVHVAPKPAVNGVVTFAVGWTAPTLRGTIDFEAFAVAANGDHTPAGDSAGQGRLSITLGCPGIELYVDADGDGFGSPKLPKERVCEAGPGYAMQAGDCNDYLSYVYPGAPELCNAIDDNCNGQVDEGLESATVYRDADGDGYGARFTMDTRVGCTSSGYAANQTDCDDTDKAIHPGAQETCNDKDDNCDGRVDEGARFTCGQGWCRREAETCNSKDCEPGDPRPEECNLFDDDCDGVIDNDAKCDDPAKVCFGGRCLSADDAKAAAEAAGQTTDGGTADGRAAPAGAGGADGGSETAVTGSGGTVGASAAASPKSGACAYGGGDREGAPPLIAGFTLLLLCTRRRRRDDPRAL